MLAINAGETANVVSAYVSAMKLTLPVILDPDKTGSRQYTVVDLPITMWIDTQGIVRAEQIGPLDQKMIASYMQMLTRNQ